MSDIWDEIRDSVRAPKRNMAEVKDAVDKAVREASGQRDAVTAQMDILKPSEASLAMSVASADAPQAYGQPQDGMQPEAEAQQAQQAQASFEDDAAAIEAAM